MKNSKQPDIPIGTRALVLSKKYYGVLTKSLGDFDIERYYSILYFLFHNNYCCQQHICNNLAINKTAMVKVMDYLIKAGYIKRKVNPGDRREHFIVLTYKGKQKTVEIVKSFKTIDRQMFAGISKTQRDTFLKVMTKLNLNLDGLPSRELYFDYKFQTKRNKTPNQV